MDATIKILNELSKKEPTELALRLMELTADNLIKGKEIERLNNIINELEKHVEDSLKLANKQETEDTISYIEDILNRLKELKEDK